MGVPAVARSTDDRFLTPRYRCWLVEVDFGHIRAEPVLHERMSAQADRIRYGANGAVISSGIAEHTDGRSDQLSYRYAHTVDGAA
jgi:hypothetical protein